jgi:hypothetical protein
MAPRVVAQACASSPLDARNALTAARADRDRRFDDQGHSRTMLYPNRAQWRMIELVVVIVSIAWVLTSPTEDHLTRLFIGLATFAVMLLARHFRR